MAWKAVGPVVKKVVDRIVDVGDAGAATPAVSLKRAASTKPAAKSQGDIIQRGKPEKMHGNHSVNLPTIGRDRRTGEHPQLGHAPAPLVRQSMLTVINGSGGGRWEEGGPCVRRLRRNSWSDRARELGIRVVG